MKDGSTSPRRCTRRTASFCLKLAVVVRSIPRLAAILDTVDENSRTVHIPDLRSNTILCRASSREWSMQSKLAGHSHCVDVPMLKDNELDRRHFQSTARKFVPSPTSRSGWFRTSLLKPSSPSRTRGCSTNCASARRPHNARPYRCARAADCHVGGTPSYLQLPRRFEPVFATMLESAARFAMLTSVTFSAGTAMS